MQHPKNRIPKKNLTHECTAPKPIIPSTFLHPIALSQKKPQLKQPTNNQSKANQTKQNTPASTPTHLHTQTHVHPRARDASSSEPRPSPRSTCKQERWGRHWYWKEKRHKRTRIGIHHQQPKRGAPNQPKANANTHTHTHPTHQSTSWPRCWSSLRRTCKDKEARKLGA